MLLNDVVREYEIGRRFGDGDIGHRDKIGYRVGAHAFLNGNGFSSFSPRRAPLLLEHCCTCLQAPPAEIQSSVHSDTDGLGIAVFPSQLPCKISLGHACKHSRSCRVEKSFSEAASLHSPAIERYCARQ
jgi:hypothetical protein